MDDNKLLNKKDSVENSHEKLKTCFVMMPIADVDSYESRHFERVYTFIIEPACRQAGFEPTIASQVKTANVIMVDILERILNADMVVCDISARNPNVLYELGIRQSFDLPVTLIKDERTRDIFDIQGIRYVPYNSQLRIDLVSEAVNLLKESILETYENREKSIFSLVQILGRDRARIKSSNVTDDTKIILAALDQLRTSGVEMGTVIDPSGHYRQSFQMTFENNFTEDDIRSVIQKLMPHNAIAFNTRDKRVIKIHIYSLKHITPDEINIVRTAFNAEFVSVIRENFD